MSLDLSWLTFVLAAGVSALLSPCGYPLLPGYISYYLGTKSSLGKAVPNGVACTLGLFSVFSVIGVFVSLLGALVAPYIPVLELAAGLVMIFLGVSMLTRITFPTNWIPLKAPKRRGIVGIFVYGVIYGLATLGCSAPIFFSILFYAVTVSGPLFATVVFAVYAVGMGLPLIITTILVAKARQIVLEKVTSVTPWLQRVSGVMLVIIGVYLTYYYYAVLASV